MAQKPATATRVAPTKQSEIVKPTVASNSDPLTALGFLFGSKPMLKAAVPRKDEVAAKPNAKSHPGPYLSPS